jgi:hypothetical protein
MRTIDLGAEARAAFPDITPKEMARASLDGKPLFDGQDIVVTLPDGTRRPITPTAGRGVDAAPAAADEVVATPPAPEPTRTAAAQRAELEADLLATQARATTDPESAALRRQAADAEQKLTGLARQEQTVRAAYGAAPPELQEAIAREMPESPTLSNYGIPISEQAKATLNDSPAGRFRFPDGYRPDRGTIEDLTIQTRHDVEFWANVEEMGNWPDTASGLEASRYPVQPQRHR